MHGGAGIVEQRLGMADKQCAARRVDPEPHHHSNADQRQRPADGSDDGRPFDQVKAACRTVETQEVERGRGQRSEEHTSELQALMRISYAVFCLKKTKNKIQNIERDSTKTKKKSH